ncbi:DUF6434 domain-containing protein [Undibacterium sp. SXout11W]|uniref:DUF6434 domain-containing protein n=1 Tax=Undibacterium sp. SXout11W TaxID=3413050 RepID=UPI003BEFED2B
MKFDWHGGQICRETMVDQDYRNTQNVRRFLLSECGAEFKFDRPFMLWIRNDQIKSMGDVADEWMRRQPDTLT